MREARPHSVTIAGLLLLAATAFFPRGAAFAGVTVTQPVTQYVVLNPIDVCAASGTGCAPFNTLKTTPGAATALTPIGFVDSTTNINVTRADWLQAGIDVTFLPIKQYNSPPNKDPWAASDTSPPNIPYSATDYRTLHVVSVTCPTTEAINLTSPDFQTLTKMSVCGAPSNANPPPLPTPAPPLHTDSKVIDVFFVNDILENSTRLAGFSWINANGIAIAKDAFSALAPRFDTLSHELGHALDLDHTTFTDSVTGPGVPCTGVSTTVAPGTQECNLMDAGSNASGQPFRIVPSSAGCSTTSPGGALYDLDTGLCSAMPSVPQGDQLNSNQTGQALISGFMNPTKNVNATAGGGAPAAPAATTTAATATSASTGSSIQFSVTDNPGFGRFNRSTNVDTETIMAIALAFPAGISPKATNPITVGTGGPTVARVRVFTPGSGDDEDDEEEDDGVVTNKTFRACHSGITCLEIDFAKGTFIDNTFNFSVNFKTNVTTGQLTGTGLTVVTDDLFATTSTFEPCGECFPPLATNSQFPDATVAAIIVRAARFVNFGAPPSFTGFGLAPCTLLGEEASCRPPVLPQGE
jgi:hypothetical protein